MDTDVQDAGKHQHHLHHHHHPPQDPSTAATARHFAAGAAAVTNAPGPVSAAHQSLLSTGNNAASHQSAAHITLPALNHPGRYGPSPSSAPPTDNAPRRLPNPNNISPPQPPLTIATDSRYIGQPPSAQATAGYQAVRSYSVDSGAAVGGQHHRLAGPPPPGAGREGSLPAPGGHHPAPSSSGPGPVEPAMEHVVGHHGSPYGMEHAHPNGLPHHGGHPGMQFEPGYGQQPPPHGQHPGPPPPPGMHPHYGPPPPPQQVPPPSPYGHPGYPPPSAGPYDAGSMRQPRKAVRAQQACQQCRQRKQKCDEGRPKCSFCEKENMACEYRETQPPKQDRGLAQVLETLEELRADSRQIKDYLRIGSASSDSSLPSAGSKRKRSEPRDFHADAAAHTNAESPGFSPPKAEDMMEDDSKEPLTTGASTNSVAAAERSYDHAQQVQANIDAQKRGEVAWEVGGIPADHKTSVQHLRSWPGIAALYEAAGLAGAPNLTQYETDQGFLRVWGIGQTGDPLEPAASNDAYAASPASDNSDPIEPEGLWGSNQVDGNLRLDEDTVLRLNDSYFKHFHIMHPFLDRPRLKNMLKNFMERYCYKPTTPFAVPAVPDKRTPGRQQADRDYATPPDYGMELPAPNRPLERSLQNAIILLILALGRIAEHKTYFRKASDRSHLPPHNMAASHASPQSVASPSANAHTSNSVRPSPTSSHATMSSAVHSPLTEGGRYDGPHGGRVASLMYGDGFGRSGRLPQRNVDIFPGLAYYAFASDVLDFHVRVGDVHIIGKPLHQIWAFILAGLYMGQLCRPMESFNWISRACKAWIHLRDTEYKGLWQEAEGAPPADPRPFNKEHDLVKFAYWTCLQLESDVRAELDFEPTGIGRYEHSVGLPKGITDDVISNNAQQTRPSLDNDVVWAYSLQVHLRRTLNRTHSYVYGAHMEPIWSGGSAILPGPKTMLAELEDLRTFIRRCSPFPGWDWTDDDALSDKVNHSRVRGKYYGARYVITRPFLQHAINKIDPQPVNTAEIVSAEELPHILRRGDLEGSNGARYTDLVLVAARWCIDAAMHSTEAFDGLKGRWIVTNIHGTALAQFGNMLVLTAAYCSWLGPSHADLVPGDRLVRLLRRTIELMANLAPISKVMAANERVLRAGLDAVRAIQARGPVSTTPVSAPRAASTGYRSATSSFGT